MKFLIVAIYLAVSTLSFAGSNYSQDRLSEFKNLNDKVENLEKDTLYNVQQKDLTYFQVVWSSNEQLISNFI